MWAHVSSFVRSSFDHRVLPYKQTGVVIPIDIPISKQEIGTQKFNNGTPVPSPTHTPTLPCSIPLPYAPVDSSVIPSPPAPATPDFSILSSTPPLSHVPAPPTPDFNDNRRKRANSQSSTPPATSFAKKYDLPPITRHRSKTIFATLDNVRDTSISNFPSLFIPSTPLNDSPPIPSFVPPASSPPYHIPHVISAPVPSPPTPPSSPTNHSPSPIPHRHFVKLPSMEAFTKDYIVKMDDSYPSPPDTPGTARGLWNGLWNFILFIFFKVKHFLRSSGQPKTAVYVLDFQDFQKNVVPFILKFGKALHSCGVPAYRVERELFLISKTFGIEGDFFYTPNALSCSFECGGYAPCAHVVRFGGVEWDLERLVLLEELLDDVKEGKLEPSQATPVVQHIVSLPVRYSPIFETLSNVVLAMGYAVLFGLSWGEARVSGVAALFVGIMLTVERKVPALGLGRVSDIAASFGAGIICGIFESYVTSTHAFLAALASVIWHVPGLSLTMAIAELCSGNSVAGTSRLVGAFTCSMRICFGAYTGLNLVEFFGTSNLQVAGSESNFGWTFVASSMAAFGYSILSKCPPKMLWSTMLAGALGILGLQLGTYFVTEPFGCFIGSFCITMFANMYARFWKNGYATLPIDIGLLILVPGSMSVKTLMSLSNADDADALARLIAVFQNGVSLAMGVIVANLVLRPQKSV